MFHRCCENTPNSPGSSPLLFCGKRTILCTQFSMAERELPFIELCSLSNAGDVFQAQCVQQAQALDQLSWVTTDRLNLRFRSSPIYLKRECHKYLEELAENICVEHLSTVPARGHEQWMFFVLLNISLLQSDTVQFPIESWRVGMVRSPISMVVITGITPYLNNIRLKRMLLGIFSIHGCKYPKRKKWCPRTLSINTSRPPSSSYGKAQGTL